jgi:putative hydrolase of the HAD superfamily
MDKQKAMKILFDLYSEYGIEYDKIFQKFLEKTMKRIDHRILAEGIVAYRKKQSGYVKPYSSVIPTMIRLKEKGLKLGIISDAPAIKAWLRLVEMGISDFFDIVVTVDDTGEKKPSKKPFEIALAKLGLRPKDVIYVGDWPERDIKGAKSLGIKTAFAKYGCQKPMKNSGADFELSDFSEVLKII